MADPALNLIDDPRVTVHLLSNPLDWRVRVVEEIVVDAATTCQRRRSLQVAPLREHLGVVVDPDATHVLLALHLAPMPRGPLLDFSASGPDGPAWLLPRTEIAQRQALFLAGLAANCGHEVDDELRGLLSTLCGFTGEFVRPGQPLQVYLADGLGRVVPAATLVEWRQIADGCTRLLRPRLDQFIEYSVMENPALALPEMFANGIVTSDEDATSRLQAYLGLLLALDDQATQHTPPNEAEDFLNALADYGNYYDLMVAVKVPLDEPFLVKYSERRSLALSFLGNRGHQSIAVADASTNHVTFKLIDPNLRIRSFEAYRAGSSDFAYGAFQFRQDPQNRAFYAHDPDRDYRIRLSFQLGLLGRLQVVPYLVATLLLLLAGALLNDQTTDLRTLAVIAGPAALAASVLLAREPSTLGSRLRLLSTATVALALLVLISVSAGLYVWGHAEAAPTERPPTPRSSPSAPGQSPPAIPSAPTVTPTVPAKK